MKKTSLVLISIFFLFGPTSSKGSSETEIFKSGIFLTNIFNLDFVNQEFSATFWIWFLHSGKHENAEELFEIVNSKDIKILHRSKHKMATGQTLNLAKVSTTVIEKWHLEDFPFDTHKLQIVVQTLGKHARTISYAQDCKNSILLEKTIKDSLNGWHVIDYDIPVNKVVYPSYFGDPDIADYDSFSTITPTLYIKRDWVSEFIRLFLVLYFSFFIAAISILLSDKYLESKVGLLSISIATIIVSKFVVDGYLPASGGFSLYSTLESITLWSLFLMLFYEVSPLFIKKHRWVYQEKGRLSVFSGFVVTYIVINCFYLGERYYKYTHAFDKVKISCEGIIGRNKELNLEIQE